MNRYWKLLLAWTRLNNRAICEMSIGRGERNDFHDYPDSVYDTPWHDMPHVCIRCSKRFFI